MYALHRRGVYLREEWKEPHMKEKELRGIKAGLLAQGEQRAQEEAALDACIAAKRKRAAQPPQVKGCCSWLFLLWQRIVHPAMEHPS
jgi:hypothetical protein